MQFKPEASTLLLLSNFYTCLHMKTKVSNPHAINIKHTVNVGYICAPAPPWRRRWWRRRPWHSVGIRLVAILPASRRGRGIAGGPKGIRRRVLRCVLVRVGVRVRHHQSVIKIWRRRVGELLRHWRRPSKLPAVMLWLLLLESGPPLASLRIFFAPNLVLELLNRLFLLLCPSCDTSALVGWSVVAAVCRRTPHRLAINRNGALRASSRTLSGGTSVFLSRRPTAWVHPLRRWTRLTDWRMLLILALSNRTDGRRRLRLDWDGNLFKRLVLAIHHRLDVWLQMLLTPAHRRRRIHIPPVPVTPTLDLPPQLPPSPRILLQLPLQPLQRSHNTISSNTSTSSITKQPLELLQVGVAAADQPLVGGAQRRVGDWQEKRVFEVARCDVQGFDCWGEGRGGSVGW